MTQTEKRAAGYIRVSTSGQAKEDKLSLENQANQIRKYCSNEDFELIEPSYEDRISGAKDGRPGLQLLLQAARNKEFSHVVVNDITRFGRSARDLLNNIHELEELGITFHSRKEKIDCSTKLGKFMLQILAACAEMELETIKVRMGEVKLAKWKAGKIALGKPPFGYQWDNEELEYILVDDEAKIYKNIVREYMKQGKSLLDITLELRRDHVPTRSKKNWFSSTVCNILRNPFYTGNAIYNVTKRGPKGKIIGEKPPEEHLSISAPELITQSEWEELQKRLNNARKQKSGRPITGANSFWLRDWVVCGVCGHKMMPRTVTGNIRYYVCYYYYCSAKQREEAFHHAKCTLPHIRAEWLEDFVSAWFNGVMFKEPSGFTPALDNDRTDKRIEVVRERIQNLQNEVERKTRGLQNLDRLMERKDFDPEGSSQTRNNLLAARRDLNAQIKKEEEELAYQLQLKADAEKFREFQKSKIAILEALYKKLGELTNEEKRKLITNSLREPIKLKPPEGEVKPSGGTFMALAGWVSCQFYYNQMIIQDIFDLSNSSNVLKQNA